MVGDPRMPLSKTAAWDYERGVRVLPSDLVGAYEVYFGPEADGLRELQAAAEREAIESRSLRDGAETPDVPTGGRSPRRWLGHVGRSLVSRRPRPVLAVGLLVVVVVAAIGGLVAATGRASSHRRGTMETTGGSARTWSDPADAGGSPGPALAPRQTVVVQCRVRGFVVEDGNGWWYRLASTPWAGRYYATADAFYNDGAVTGSLLHTPFVDDRVPVC